MDKPIPKAEIKKALIKRWAIAAASVGAAALLVGAVLSMTRTSIKRSELRSKEVTVATIETTVSSSGRVVPAFEEIISSPISSRILEVYCKAGDSVSTGTPILKLDLQNTQIEYDKLANQRQMTSLDMEQLRLSNITYLNNLEMKIKVQNMELERLKAEVANERYLDSLGSGTGESVRKAELAHEKCRLELLQLKEQYENEKASADMKQQSKELQLNIADKDLAKQSRLLEDALLRSPRRATLTFVNDIIGQPIGQGEKIAVIADLDHFKLEGSIADTHAEKVMPGGKAVIHIGKQKYRGTIQTVTPQSAGGAINFDVKLDSDSTEAEAKLRPGLRADIYVVIDMIADAVAMPNIPSYRGPGEYKVYVDKGDELELRTVSLGDGNYEFIEVKTGLSPGEKVVTLDMSRFNTSTIKVTDGK